MIGATASDDVSIFEISREVARYPLNSMDFIEFNGSDSLTECSLIHKKSKAYKMDSIYGMHAALSDSIAATRGLLTLQGHPSNNVFE
jgi:hypothetical protein